MFKKILYLVCGMSLLAACGHAPQFSPLAANAHVVILGDSLTYGTGAAKGQDYVSLLAQRTGWEIANEGVAGDTSAQGMARLTSLLEARTEEDANIDLLLIELGGNDFLRRIPNTETIANLKAMIAQAKAQGITTGLIAIPEFNPAGAAFGHLSDHPLYAALAKETGVFLIEDVFSKVLSKNALKSDYVHPNAQGYRMVAEQLHESLIDLGLAAK